MRVSWAADRHDLFGLWDSEVRSLIWRFRRYDEGCQIEHVGNTGGLENLKSKKVKKAAKQLGFHIGSKESASFRGFIEKINLFSEPKWSPNNNTPPPTWLLSLDKLPSSPSTVLTGSTLIGPGPLIPIAEGGGGEIGQFMKQKKPKSTLLADTRVNNNKKNKARQIASAVPEISMKNSKTKEISMKNIGVKVQTAGTKNKAQCSTASHHSSGGGGE